MDTSPHNLVEIDQLFKKFKLPKFTQIKIVYLNTPLAIKEINFFSLKLCRIICLVQDIFTGELHHRFKEELTLILHYHFQKIEEGTHVNLFYGSIINLIPKPDKDNAKK